MPVYPNEIAALIREPRFCGSLTTADATGTGPKFDCGCVVRLEMRIDRSTNRIEKCVYRTNGCGYMTAAAEAISSTITGRCLTDLQGKITVRPEFEERAECSATVLRAAQDAFAHHRARLIEEFRGEKALICTCFGVTEESIEEFVASSHTLEVDDVTRELRAGSGCGSCRMLIQEIIDANA